MFWQQWLLLLLEYTHWLVLTLVKYEIIFQVVISFLCYIFSFKYWKKWSITWRIWKWWSRQISSLIFPSKYNFICTHVWMARYFVEYFFCFQSIVQLCDEVDFKKSKENPKWQWVSEKYFSIIMRKMIFN